MRIKYIKASEKKDNGNKQCCNYASTSNSYDSKEEKERNIYKKKESEQVSYKNKQIKA